MSFLTAAQLLAPELLALKQDLHAHPELSFQEKRTTALLREKLTALGLALIDIGMDTGVVALLRGGHAGKTVALRADMDAICQQEPAGPGASEVPGIMHACGHDFHTAALYGAATLLAAERERLCGNVAFLFQPAEEVTRGAAAMVEHGLWDALPQRPCALFGLHNRPELPRGQVAVIEGPVMAGKVHFEITLRGLAGHGGSPHKCIDVIVPGAAIVSALQSVVSRNTDPMDALVCSVCSIHAGTPENFAPDLLTMTGSIRAHSNTVLEHTQARIWTLARGIGESYGCTAEVQFIPQVPVTCNTPEMTALARRAALAVVGAAQIVSPPPDLGSEDFAVFGQEVPSFFYWLGSGFPGRENACWHSPYFRTDDGALPLGAALLAQAAAEGLEGN
ncbi:MAG: M20 family metallopeptidase [Pseudoflavonifractor sp.]